MEQIEYVKGDATAPLGEGDKIIVHVCNDIGGWGRGFVLALSKKWPEPEVAYRKWFKSKENFSLGEVQFVPVEEGLWVANMIGQRDIVSDEQGRPPVRYEAVKACLNKVATFALENNLSVHTPRIGCGLAGGQWEQMEPIVFTELAVKGLKTTVYDLE